MTGAGQNIFVGGGVLVNVGHQQQTAFVCLMRAGYGMTALGAGVFIHIAELENRAWGAAAIVGAGQVYSNGAGVFDKTGGEVVNSAISAFQALVGGSAYVRFLSPNPLPPVVYHSRLECVFVSLNCMHRLVCVFCLCDETAKAQHSPRVLSFLSSSFLPMIAILARAT